MSISIGVSNDGILTFHDGSGQEISEHLVLAAKRQHGDAIRDLIERACEQINTEIDAVGELHLLTPSSETKPVFEAREFAGELPHQPAKRRLGFIQSFFKSQRTAVETEYEAALADHTVAIRKWKQQQAAFESFERHRRELIESRIYNDVPAMEEFLEVSLKNITWPRETNVCAELVDAGQTIFIDADLPEVEDMPNRKAVYGGKGYKLSVKELSSTDVRKLYMKHIHGIAFRTIGETFSVLPNSKIVVFSGYSQRADKATGRITDEYLLSVRVKRSEWRQINFEDLINLDAVEGLARFDLRRSMTKTGIFKPIVPYSPQDKDLHGV